MENEFEITLVSELRQVHLIVSSVRSMLKDAPTATILAQAERHLDQLLPQVEKFMAEIRDRRSKARMRPPVFRTKSKRRRVW